MIQAWVCSQKRQVICPAQAHRDQSNPKFQGAFTRCFTCNFFSTMFFPLIHRNPNGYVYKNKDHGEKLSPGTIFHRARRENLSPGTIFHRARREKLSSGTIFHIAWRENLSPGTCFPSNLSGTGTHSPEQSESSKVFCGCFTCKFLSTTFVRLIHRNPNGYV